MIFVLGKDGRFLKPVFRIKQVKNWLISGNAEVVNHHPLTIKLMGDTSAYLPGTEEDMAVYRNAIVHPYFKSKNLFIPGNSYRFKDNSKMITFNEGSEKQFKTKLHTASSILRGKEKCLSFSKHCEQVSVSPIVNIGTKAILCDAVSQQEMIGHDLVVESINRGMSTGIIPSHIQAHITYEREDINMLESLSHGFHAAEEKAKVSANIVPSVSKTNKWLGLTSASAYSFGTGDSLIDSKETKPGDIILGFSSNGLHTTGFDLVNTTFIPNDNDSGEWIADQMKRILTSYTHDTYDEDKETLVHSGRILWEEILKPSTLYIDALKTIVENNFSLPSQIVNISEGGFLNFLNPGTKVKYVISSFPKIPRVYQLIKNKLGFHIYEMFVNFNMGIGMCMVIPKTQERLYLRQFNGLEFDVSTIGYVEESPVNTIVIKDENLIWEN